MNNFPPVALVLASRAATVAAANSAASAGSNVDGLEIAFIAVFVAILVKFIYSKAASEGTSWGKLSVASLVALLCFLGSLAHTDLLAVVDANGDGSLKGDELESAGVFLGAGFLFLQFAFHVVVRGCYKYQTLQEALTHSSTGGWRKKICRAQGVNGLRTVGHLLGGVLVMIIILYSCAPGFMDRDKDRDVDLTDVALLFDTNDDKNLQSGEIVAASFVLLGSCWGVLLSIQAILLALMAGRAQYVHDKERKRILASMDKAQDRWKKLGDNCRNKLEQRLRDDWDDVAEAYRKYHSLSIQFSDIEFDPPSGIRGWYHRHNILKAVSEGYVYATCVSAGANGVILRSKLYSYPKRKLLRFEKRLTVALKLALGGTESQKAQLTHENTVLAALQMNMHPNSVTYFGNLSRPHSTMKFVTVTKENVVQKYEVDNVLVMEYLEDGDLNAAIHHGSLSAKCGALTLTRKLNIIQGIAKGMAAVHDCGYIHKDLKPANIAVHVDSTGQVVPKILDYGGGICVEQNPYRDGVLGTPGYIAPEIWRRYRTGDVTIAGVAGEKEAKVEEVLGINGMRVDVFSFGIIANEILRATGNDLDGKGTPMIDCMEQAIQTLRCTPGITPWSFQILGAQLVNAARNYDTSNKRPWLFSEEHDPLLFHEVPYKEGIGKIHDLIQSCWNTDKTCRPQFIDIVQTLSTIVTEQNRSLTQQTEEEKKIKWL